MSKIPIQNNKILFATFNGDFTCNPKAIAEEILRRNLNWDIVWASKSSTSDYQFPSGIKIVPQKSAEYYTEIASARIIITNAITTSYTKSHKKKGQLLFQTWHGSLGIKRFDTNNDKKWRRIAKVDGKITDYCISNSTFETDLYKNTFWQNAEILPFGHARNDILFLNDDNKIQAIKEKLYDFFNIPKDAKVALYAPTFRDDMGIENYNIDYIKLKEALTRKFGGNWVILSRLHPRIKNKYLLKKGALPDFVINASEYPDVQEILLITDVGITDYSSWICDYLLRKLPGFIYAPDLKEYNTERGFYYPLEELPFPISENNDQLINNILNFDNEKFVAKYETFMTARGCYENGNAAEKVVDFLEKIIDGSAS